MEAAAPRCLQPSDGTCSSNPALAERVRIRNVGLDEAEGLAEVHGGWVAGMASCLGQEGTVGQVRGLGLGLGVGG